MAKVAYSFDILRDDFGLVHSAGSQFNNVDVGYALDWSPLVPGRLVSGNCKNFIHPREPTTGATWNIESNPFVGHRARVEDWQWCSTIPSLIASRSEDGSVALLDSRVGKSPAPIIKSHEADVNLISWNSFDILCDDWSWVHSEFPYTVCCVAGTQAKEASSNYIGIFKLSNISGNTSYLLPTTWDAQGSYMESHSSNIDDDDEEEGGSGAPMLQLPKVFHVGGVNRIRAMSQNPHICALWEDTGYVQVWDLCPHLTALDEAELTAAYEDESTAAVSNGDTAAFNRAPLAKFKHEDKGYALNWSPLIPGRLVSGDCKNFIHLWEPTSDATWNNNSNPRVGHTASVKDLQWCPTLPYGFLSCSADGSVALWDTRSRESSPAASIMKAHEAGVNVISWNRLKDCLLASGSDDGSFSIWDLRKIYDGNSFLCSFDYHKHPITSIEWSPHEITALVVSSDNEFTIWDLIRERDEEEDAPSDLPTELVSVHRGRKNVKELHWHPKIPGMLISTTNDSFNVTVS